MFTKVFMQLKRLAHWLIRRFRLILALVLFSSGAIVIWVIDTDVSQGTSITIKIAAMTALFAALGSFATLIQAVETQKQRESHERPYVIVYFDLTSTGEIYFFIQNIGNSPALNATVIFDDPTPLGIFRSPLGIKDNPISFLAPSQSIRQLVGYGQSVLQEGNPTKFQITIQYLSANREIYKEKIIHDLSYLWQINFPQRSVEESLDAIAKNLFRANSRESASRSPFGPPSTEASLAKIAKELESYSDKQPGGFSNLISRIFALFRKKPPN